MGGMVNKPCPQVLIDPVKPGSISNGSKCSSPVSLSWRGCNGKEAMLVGSDLSQIHTTVKGVALTTQKKLFRTVVSPTNMWSNEVLMLA